MPLKPYFVTVRLATTTLHFSSLARSSVDAAISAYDSVNARASITVRPLLP